MGLVARSLESAGIPTVTTSVAAGITRKVNPPRATITRLHFGAILGAPGDVAQQRRVLEKTLNLFSQDAPISLVSLNEKWIQE